MTVIDVYPRPLKAKARQYLGGDDEAMKEFVGISNWLSVSRGLPRVWNSHTHQWADVRLGDYVLLDNEGSARPVTSQEMDALYAPNRPREERDQALRSVRNAQINLGDLRTIVTGLTASLEAVSAQLGDDVAAFRRQGRDDNDTRARDHLRDVAEGLLMVCREARKSVGQASNDLSHAAGSLRR
ncbi:hypothetical protein ABZ470_23825 [Streptosporangium sp. NPDC020072]|uniref:hypothetical protein n=1 Tax=Streptosporangium sp. NPDC020072 TaxID=3154788 RepID=UPI00342A3C80